MRSKLLEPERLTVRLARAPQLAGLNEVVRLRIARGSTHRPLRSGDLLWSTGDRPRMLAFVLIGELTVERLTADGHRHVFRRYSQDGLIGLSTVAGAPHTADVRASTDTEVLLLPGAFLLQEPAFIEAAFESLATLIGALSDDYQALLYSDIDERISRYLRQAAMNGMKEIRKSHQELADEIGATRSNVARAIRRLVHRGVLEQARERIILRDPDALDEACAARRRAAR